MKLLKINAKEYSLNYDKIDGNTTASALMDACKNVVEWSDHDVEKFDKLSSQEKNDMVKTVFGALGYNSDFIVTSINEDDAMFRIWHLLYSYEGDSSTTGNDGLVKHIQQLTSLPEDYATALVNVRLEQDYGSQAHFAFHEK